MKKTLSLLLAITMVIAMTACGLGGGSINERAIVGIWKLVDTDTETEYGLGIEFTKDGKLRYGLTEDILSGLSEGEDVSDALNALEMLMSIKYDVKSDTELEITVSALFGLASESEIIPYSLNGDTLEFDGATYTRAK